LNMEIIYVDKTIAVDGLVRIRQFERLKQKVKGPSCEALAFRFIGSPKVSD